MITALNRACAPLAGVAIAAAVATTSAAGASCVAIAAAVATTSAAGASQKTTISFTLCCGQTEYVTQRSLTHTYPGKLTTGDRIFSQDTLVERAKKIGYDNEACTVTFEGSDLCHAVSVFPGKGELDATWLWIGRNNSYLGPRHFSGVVDGGTGTYANATGQFDATVDTNGTLEFTATLNRG
jgi:hypothetical protein